MPSKSKRKADYKKMMSEPKPVYKPFTKLWFTTSLKDERDKFLLWIIFICVVYSLGYEGVYIRDSAKIHYILFLGCLGMIFYQLAFRNNWGEMLQSVRKTFKRQEGLTLAEVNLTMLAFMFLSADLAAIFVIDYDKIGKAGNYVVVTSLGIGLIRAFYAFVKSIGDNDVEK